MRMADKLEGEVTKDIVQPLMMRSLYSIGEKKDLFSRSCCKRRLLMNNNDFKAKKSYRCFSAKRMRDRKKEVTVVGSKGE
jgi:hypothetical protein